jgi:hypothetical protein
MMEKWDKKDKREHKAKYGHTGVGSSKTREASTSEVERHIQKIKAKANKKRKG